MVYLISKDGLECKILSHKFLFLQEDIKSLSTYIVETFQKDLEGVKYVKTFETLKLRYEQQRDRSRDKHAFDRYES